MLRILHIVEGTSVDGPGLRTSIYMAGCNHHCPGCHNPASWDPQGGEERTLDELMQVIAYNEAPVTKPPSPSRAATPCSSPTAPERSSTASRPNWATTCGVSQATPGRR